MHFHEIEFHWDFMLTWACHTPFYDEDDDLKMYCMGGEL